MTTPNIQTIEEAEQELAAIQKMISEVESRFSNLAKCKVVVDQELPEDSDDTSILAAMENMSCNYADAPFLDIFTDVY